MSEQEKESGKLDELARNLVSSVARFMPPGMADARDDLEKNFRAVLAAWFDRLDLVTREEFDVQMKVLRKTREKLKALETRIEQLDP